MQAFYEDFAHVADDESRHLGWCLQRLEELGYSYGDIPAHSILWEGAQKSAGTIWHRNQMSMNQLSKLIFVAACETVLLVLQSRLSPGKHNKL